MKKTFTALFQKRGKWYVGWVEEIPGVNTQGRTLRAARKNLQEALALILEANREIHPPKNSGAAALRESISIEAAS